MNQNRMSKQNKFNEDKAPFVIYKICIFLRIKLLTFLLIPPFCYFSFIFRSSSLEHKNSSSSHHSTQDSKNQDSGSQNDKKKPHIKKPLNAFMLYMKEMRAKVVAECTLKESAAINQILGRRVSN